MKRTVLALALAGIGAMAHAVTYDISSSSAAWQASNASIGAFVLGQGTFAPLGCAPGVACAGVVLNGLPGVGFAQVGPGSASYDGGLLNNLGTGGYLQWNFATPQNAWGGLFNMTPGNGLSFMANDLNLGWIDVTTVGAGQTLSGFLGFTSADRFSGVRVSGLSDGSSYRMTEVAVAVVPEPGTYMLMFAGLAAVGLVARNRKTKA
ncbi:MAG: PEP-CTERM sorting domain-containing protein [bacterium]|jgi:hypothetical protein